MPKFTTPVSAGALVAATLYCACAAPSGHAAVVAYWRFEPGSFLADSAGANTLSNNGVAPSNDTSPAAPGGGSASFPGTQTVFSTTSALNLSSFEDLTVECFFKTTQSSLGLLFEHAPASVLTPGAFGSAINDLSNELEIYQRAASGTFLEETNLPVLNGQWHHMAMTLDGSETGNNRLTLFVDGVAVGVDNQQNPIGTAALLNEVFFIGSRRNNEFPYAGLLDELRISDRILAPSEFLNVPEPTLLSLAALSLGTLVRRRRA